MEQKRQYISIWLSILALMIIAIVILGGYTRLSGSGLSIVEWAPVSGIVPPLSQGAWEAEFAKYRLFPEYQLVNSAMTLSEFKFIFMVEFLHRILGRVIGLTMLLPLIYFCLRGYIRRQELGKYVAMLLMLALQGFIGWYMVKSGLSKDPHVSHYRLSIHLITAILLYSFIVWQIIPRRELDNKPLKIQLALLLMLVYVQTFFGAMVAGLKAGLVYNTFPLMGSSFIPYELDILNLNDAVTVQFIHRFLAYTVFIVAAYLSWKMYRTSSQLAVLLFASCLLQVLLGVLTLLYIVLISLALLHQFGAIVLITCLIYVIKKV